MEVLHAFILIGAAQGLLAAIILSRREKTRAGRFLLASALLALSIRLAFYPFKGAMEAADLKDWYNFSLILLLLVGPGIYGFVLTRVTSTKEIKPLFAIHYLPFFIYLTHLFYPFYIPVCYSYATLFSGMIYGTLSLGVICWKKWKEKLVRINYSHLYSFAFPLAFIPTSIYFLAWFPPPGTYLHPATYPYLVLTLLFYRFTLLALINPPRKKGSIQSSPFDERKLQKIREVVEKEELFLEQVSVVDVAQKTGLSRHEVSSIIIQGTGLSFRDFINQYRIGLVVERIKRGHHQNLTLEALGKLCGFRSKSTFYAAFKAHTGKTPKQFLRASR